MAKNNRDRLIDTFLSRNQNRRRKPGLTSTPNITGTNSSYRPYKGGVDPRTAAARGEFANRDARYDVAKRNRKRSY